MKRFFKTLVLLVLALLLLVSGVDAALDHIALDPAQASFTLYNQRGEVMLTYDGNLAHCSLFTHPSHILPRAFPPRAGLAPRA